MTIAVRSPHTPLAARTARRSIAGFPAQQLPAASKRASVRVGPAGSDLFRTLSLVPTTPLHAPRYVPNFLCRSAATEVAIARPGYPFLDNAPSWETLTSMAESKQREANVNFWTDLEKGPTNALATTRTFGKEGPIRVKLYRDHAAWCPYCQKVWLQLEEKQIPYTMEKINLGVYGDKPAEFLEKINPKGSVPVLEIDGRVVTESAVIMALLEEEFPEVPLLPPKGSPSRERADRLMAYTDKFLFQVLGFIKSDSADESAFQAAMTTLCDELEADGGPYILGSQVSLVDLNMAPVLERAAAALAYYRGIHMRGEGRWPAIDRWFSAMESRSSFRGTQSDYYSHCHHRPIDSIGVMTDGGRPTAAAIDGTDGLSWRLPLPPLSATSLPEPYSPGDNPQLDRLQAAARLVKNHDAIVKFALRGPAPKPEPRPFLSPLADPTALPALQYLSEADCALRHVVHALLVGVEAKQVSEQALQVVPGSVSESSAAVVAAAEYLRDRVGVPRDLPFPAARQLRAHLNWLIDTLQAA